MAAANGRSERPGASLQKNAAPLCSGTLLRQTRPPVARSRPGPWPSHPTANTSSCGPPAAPTRGPARDA
eukprot:2249450-Lingulodinium_polyedra.AAC.1